MPPLTRAEVILEIEGLARESLLRIGRNAGLGVADISLVDRKLVSVDQDAGELADDAKRSTLAVSSGARDMHIRRQLAQIWAILDAVHQSLLSGTKMTQRELW